MLELDSECTRYQVALLIPFYFSTEWKKQKTKLMLKVSFLIQADSPLYSPLSVSLSLCGCVAPEGIAAECFIVVERIYPNHTFWQ